MLLILVVFCLGEFVSARCPSGSKPPGDVGIQLAQQGKLEQAAECFQQAVDTSNGAARGQWLTNLAKSLESAGNVDAALPVWIESFQLHSKPDIQDMARVANYHRNYKQMDKAADIYQQCIDIYPGVPELHFNLALTLNDMTQHDRAIGEYMKALKLKPNWKEATRMMAFSHLWKGNAQQAIAVWTQEIKKDPNNAEAYSELGQLYLEAKQLDKASDMAKKAIQLAPEKEQVLSAAGLVFLENANFKDAMKAYSKMAELNPKNKFAFYGLGNVAERSGHPEKGYEYFLKAVEIDPNFSDAYFNAGTVLQQLKRHDDAVNLFQQAIDTNPTSADAYINMGVSLRSLGRFHDAVEMYRKSIKVDPRPQAFGNLATCLEELGRLKEAIDIVNQGIAMDPNYAHGYNILGTLMRPLGRFKDAAKAYVAALRIAPNFVDAALNLAAVYVQVEKFDKALDTVEKGFIYSPDDMRLPNEIFNLKRRVADWSNWRVEVETLTKNIIRQMQESPKLSLQPFQAETYPVSNELVKQVANFYAADAERKGRLQLPDPLKILKPGQWRPQPGQRLRVAFLSADFRQHPMGYLFQSMFGLLSRDLHEYFCYSTSEDDHSSYRKRISHDVEHFVDVYGLAEYETAIRINEDKIHLMFDFNGWTAGHKAEVFALKPVPVQCLTGVAYFGTWGGFEMDTFLSDRHCSPVEIAPAMHYEKLIYMPNTYQINDHKQSFAFILKDDFQPTDRAQIGLPVDGVVYANFNSFQKIEPRLFAAWTEIIKRVPNSALWLLKNPEEGERRVREEWNRRGLEDHRLVMSPLTGPHENLARMGTADIHLDTLLFNGHTTSADALWTGLPVLTTPGVRLPARVAGSFGYAMDTTTVAINLREYVEIAVALGLNKEALKRHKKKIRDVRETSALFDTERWTKDLERSVRQQWEIFAAGVPTMNIVIH